MAEQFLKNKKILSIAGIIIGAILMIWQRTALITLIRITGYVLIAAGITYLVFYISGKEKNEVQLSYAVISGGGGLLMVLLSRTIVNIFPILMGVLLIVNGITALVQTIRSPIVPVYNKILSAAAVALGLLIVIRPAMITNTIVFWIGVAFAVGGISGLVTKRF